MKCGLGEAPFFETKTNTLRFVDIVKQKLHVVDLGKGPTSLKSWDLSSPIRFVAFRQDSSRTILVLIPDKYNSRHRRQ